MLRGVSILLLAIAAAGLPWYFVTRSAGSGSDERPGASAEPSSPAASASSPAATLYEVYGVDSPGCVNVRAEPSTSATRINCLRAGTRLESDGKTQEVAGLLWRHVLDPIEKVRGWIADRYLRPV